MFTFACALLCLDGQRTSGGAEASTCADNAHDLILPLFEGGPNPKREAKLIHVISSAERPSKGRPGCNFRLAVWTCLVKHTCFGSLFQEE